MIELDDRHREMAMAACNFVYEEIYKHDVYGFQLLDRPVGRVLDIGAHVGMASLACRLLWPEAQVICVEPPTGNQLTLQRMIDGMDIQLLQAAFGPDGQELFHCGTQEKDKVTGAHGYFTPEIWASDADRETTAKSVGMAGMSLPALLEYFGNSPGRLLVKIDCEGGEWAMIRDRNSDKAVRLVDYLPMEVHTWSESLKGVTYDETAEWAAHFKTTHEVFLPERGNCGGGGFMLCLLRKGFVTDDCVERLRRHFMSQENGRTSVTFES